MPFCAHTNHCDSIPYAGSMGNKGEGSQLPAHDVDDVPTESGSGSVTSSSGHIAGAVLEGRSRTARRTTGLTRGQQREAPQCGPSVTGQGARDTHPPAHVAGSPPASRRSAALRRSGRRRGTHRSREALHSRGKIVLQLRAPQKRVQHLPPPQPGSAPQYARSSSSSMRGVPRQRVQSVHRQESDSLPQQASNNSDGSLPVEGSPGSSAEVNLTPVRESPFSAAL